MLLRIIIITITHYIGEGVNNQQFFRMVCNLFSFRFDMVRCIGYH
jgi:hypothetical protein